jgi:threonine dehydrogenase-like Zn-dependent dehydrogenase
MMVEPLACALHAVLRNRPNAGDRVLVLGAGTLGLLVLAALRHTGPAARVIIVAKHEHQREHAATLGADTVCTPEAMLRTVRFETRARLVESRVTSPFLLGGVDICFECTGTADGLTDAMACTRAGGTVVMVGMQGRSSIDLSPAWHRELNLRGAYGYGVEGGSGERTFTLALEAAAAMRPGDLVADPYPLEDYRDAVAHAAAAGSRGAVKIAFSPQPAAAGALS